MRNVNDKMRNAIRRKVAQKNNAQPHFSFPHLYFSFLLFLLPLLFSACGVPEDRFRVEGRFKNLNQGEFYLYNLEKGTNDTLHINDGRFVYDISLHDTTTMVLMFPNFSELPIFARPGALVTIKGDVSHLKETEIKGTAENEAMTTFRMATNELMPPEVLEKAELFINDHPESVVSVYLLHRYFIMNVEDDYPKAFKLCTTLLENQPSNLQLRRLHQRLERLQNLHQKGQLPTFRAVDTTGKNVSNDYLNAKVNVIIAWASWSFESQNAIRQLNTLQKEHPKDLKVVSICLDASPVEGRLMLQHDSITWPNVCDGELWNSPVLSQLGLTFVPDNIITGKYGNIEARSLSTIDLRAKTEKLLEEQP
jgi:hypothetical protein